MDVSIIIHNYNTKNLLKQCVRQIEEMNVDVDYEIIVVDSNSNDGSTEMMRKFYPQINFIAAKENLGFHKGNNLGIKKAQGKYILIINTDIVFVYEDVIKKMFDFMESHSDVALAGPQVLNPDKTIQHSAMRFHKIWTPFCRRTFIGKTKRGKEELERFEMDNWSHNGTKDVDWIFGACMMARKKAIEEVGMLDENLFLYFGDTDWARRFWKAGWEVYYIAEAKAVHIHRRESADVNVWQALFSPIVRIHVKDWIKYLRKWGMGEERISKL
ncbi:MAG: glycosyltransferase family 2 protein [bacterium]